MIFIEHVHYKWTIFSNSRFCLSYVPLSFMLDGSYIYSKYDLNVIYVYFDFMNAYKDAHSQVQFWCPFFGTKIKYGNWVPNWDRKILRNSEVNKEILQMVGLKMAFISGPHCHIRAWIYMLGACDHHVKTVNHISAT